MAVMIKIFSLFSVTVGLAGSALMQPVMLSDIAQSPAQSEPAGLESLPGDAGQLAQDQPSITEPQVSPHAANPVEAAVSPNADAGADIVMRGGGDGDGSQPYQFQLENEVQD
jgi:hypothetical protein